MRSKRCAVKTTRLNPRPRREKSGETLLGHRPYPNAKADGDQSMAEKQGTGELAKPAALQGPRDMAKAGLPEPQIPAMESHIPRHGKYGRGRRNRAVVVSPPKRSFRRATANEAVEGNERGAYLTLRRSTSRDTGSPTGREAQGDGAAVVVRGRENRLHGEGPQVLGRLEVKAAVMATAETGLAAYADPGVGRQSTGKPDEIERFLSGLVRGCGKVPATATRRHPTLPHVRFDERDLETEPSGHRARSRLYSPSPPSAAKPVSGAGPKTGVGSRRPSAGGGPSCRTRPGYTRADRRRRSPPLAGRPS
jgi:hypothetical protein